jgi:hypothetical protein
LQHQWLIGQGMPPFFRQNQEFADSRVRQERRSGVPARAEIGNKKYKPGNGSRRETTGGRFAKLATFGGEGIPGGLPWRYFRNLLLTRRAMRL